MIGSRARILGPLGAAVLIAGFTTTASAAASSIPRPVSPEASGAESQAAAIPAAPLEPGRPNEEPAAPAPDTAPPDAAPPPDTVPPDAAPAPETAPPEAPPDPGTVPPDAAAAPETAPPPPAPEPATPNTAPPALPPSSTAAPESASPEASAPVRSGKRVNRRRPWIPAWGRWHEQPRPGPDAFNRSRTIQVVIQVQIGCLSHCYGTSQSQLAVQEAATEQVAVAPGGRAGNESVIEQYVWQLQLGCVAFCFGATATQVAHQRADSRQTAWGREATNWSSTVQRSVQLQPRTADIRKIHWAFAGLLMQLARDPGVTIQVTRQVQVAGCLQRCIGDSIAQVALQQAFTSQHAVAGPADARAA